MVHGFTTASVRNRRKRKDASQSPEIERREKRTTANGYTGGGGGRVSE